MNSKMETMLTRLNIEIRDIGDYISFYQFDKLRFEIPKSANFTDTQLISIISTANEAFQNGFNMGKLAKLYEIKKALGVI